jgi:hypothetical protein
MEKPLYQSKVAGACVATYLKTDMALSQQQRHCNIDKI